MRTLFFACIVLFGLSSFSQDLEVQYGRSSSTCKVKDTVKLKNGQPDSGYYRSAKIVQNKKIRGRYVLNYNGRELECRGFPPRSEKKDDWTCNKNLNNGLSTECSITFRDRWLRRL